MKSQVPQSSSLYRQFFEKNNNFFVFMIFPSIFESYSQHHLPLGSACFTQLEYTHLTWHFVFRKLFISSWNFNIFSDRPQLFAMQTTDDELNSQMIVEKKYWFDSHAKVQTLCELYLKTLKKIYFNPLFEKKTLKHSFLRVGGLLVSFFVELCVA